MTNQQRERSNRGFASMDKERQRQIAAEGGRAAHQKGTAHQFTPREAREAGAKGGRAAHEKGTAHEFTPEEARRAGAKGGRAAHEKGTAHEFTSEEARIAGAKGGRAARDRNNNIQPVRSEHYSSEEVSAVAASSDDNR
ncbi:MAG TPA: KGG domain-containing protein [Dongiaceae bacterium]|nr:KGG domain-containing protein [Dongiaceae bacterium]